MSAGLAIAAALALAAVAKVKAAGSGSRSARAATWPEVYQSMLRASAKHEGGPRDARLALGHGDAGLLWTREPIPVASLEVRPFSRSDVARYARRMQKGEVPPPVVVAERDRGRLSVVDGAHRVAAAKSLGQTELDAWVGRLPPAGAGPRGSRSAPRFRMVRDVPPGYSTASWAFVRGLALEDVVDELDEDEGEEPADDHRLYHVTTNASAVLGSRIKSRKQLRAQGVTHAGLGGGAREQAADLVSVAVTLSRATAIRDGLKVMVRAARKEIEPADALIAAMRWNNFPDRFFDLARYDATPDEEDGDLYDGPSAYDEMMRVVMDTIHLPERDVDEPPTTREGWVRWIEQNRSTLNEEDAYGLVVRFEGAILDTIDLFPDEIEMCANGVGFTMPAAQMAKIDTNEIKILLVAAKGAPVDVVTGECELRFWPDQLVVVGVEV